MNVIRTNVTDRNRVSPDIPAEPVGIVPRNYSVLHLATAKRLENSLLNQNSLRPDSNQKPGTSNSVDTLESRIRSIFNNTTSSSTKPSSNDSPANFLKYIPNFSSSNTKPSSTTKSSNSLQESYPQLFRQIGESSLIKTPKQTLRKTPKSSTRTSSKASKVLRTVTSDSFQKESQSIVAISEGRGLARGEIGIASLDISCPHLILCQISDTQTYSNTLIKINVLNPIEIVLPHTFCDGSNVSKLYSSIQDAFPSVNLTVIHRRHFNDGKGLQQIKNICATEYASVEMLVSHKFYALCASAALLRYVEYKQSTVFLPKSLKIEYQGPHNFTTIDVDSAHRLELVKSSNGSLTQHCLLGVLNNCRTNGGTRLLRANILEPPCSLETILYRLECVQEMVSKPELLHTLQSILVKVNNADRLLALCMHTPQQDNSRAAELQMNYVLLLKTTLEQIPILSTALENTESQFLNNVREDMKNPHYSLIMKRISETIQEDAHISKHYVTAQYQRCFAVKPGVNGLLDVARKTYSELIEDMIEMVQKIGETCGLPITLKFNALRGFHIQIVTSNKKLYKESDLPSNFIQVQKRRNSLSFTTQELIHADERCNDVRNEIQMMSNVVIFKLLVEIRDYIGCLYKLCENLSYLDMLVSFGKVSSLQNFVLPKFGNILDVKSSRHPILEFINPTEPTANDITSSVDSNVHILTGPNMSGKSIYIRQVVLLQILAQIGCYVPAQEATFRISDRIFTRIGFDDSIECNASTFVLEMREIQYILQTITPKSLIIMDELCRGTSSEEGTAVAWALCENLLQSDAFVFLTTHFMLLTHLENVYTNVKNYHFEVLNQEENETHLTFSHRLLPGPTESDVYGILLAEILGIPESIAKEARILTNTISCKEQQRINIINNITDDRLYLELYNGLNLAQNPLTRLECLNLKYKIFPFLTTSEELIEIGELIPSSSSKKLEKCTWEENRNDSLSERSVEECVSASGSNDIDVQNKEEMNNDEGDENRDQHEEHLEECETFDGGENNLNDVCNMKFEFQKENLDSDVEGDENHTFFDFSAPIQNVSKASAIFGSFDDSEEDEI